MDLQKEIELLKDEVNRLRDELGALWYSFNMYRLDQIEEKQSYWDKMEDEYENIR